MEIRAAGRRVFFAGGGRPFDPARPAMLLLHGAGLDHTVWSMQARYFAHHGYSVLAPDLPGHGRSEGEGFDSIEAAADWVEALLAAVAVRQVSICGHSMGGLIALATAARLGERVRALALLGVIPKLAVHPALLGAAEQDRHDAYEFMVGWGHSRRAQMGGHRAPGNWAAGASLRLLETGRSGVLARDLAACANYQGALAAAAAIRCPVLALAGADDRMTAPRLIAPLVEALADCRLVALPGAGHLMMAEQPDETLDALAAFFAGTG